MGVSQSPAYLSIAFQDVAKSIEDDQLKWFLQYLRYLDDLQIGITAEEIIGFQNKTDLQDPELSRQCQDPDCCPYVGDLFLPDEDVLVEVVPANKQHSTCHLFRQRQFGKEIFHYLVLRAATLEAALVKTDLLTKDATTSLQQHFQHKFVNAARELYTQVLLEGGTPEFHLLSRLPPPPHLQIWEPDEHGLPRRWHRPWTRKGTPGAPPTPPVPLQEEEPILRMTASPEHPTDPSKLICLGATLLSTG